MFNIFRRLQDIAHSSLGEVKEAHLYPSGLVVIEGTKANGEAFRMTLNPNWSRDMVASDGHKE